MTDSPSASDIERQTIYLFQTYHWYHSGPTKNELYEEHSIGWNSPIGQMLERTSQVRHVACTVSTSSDRSLLPHFGASRWTQSMQQNTSWDKDSHLVKYLVFDLFKFQPRLLVGHVSSMQIHQNALPMVLTTDINQPPRTIDQTSPL